MKKILLCFYLLFSSEFLMAHPHVFFENTFELIQPEKNTLTFNLTLYLDEMNTLLAKENEDNSHFYKDIEHDFRLYYNGKKVENKVISKNMEFDDTNMIIKISLQYSIPNLKKGDNLVFTIYDSEYFYDYEYDKSSLTIDSNFFNFNFSLKEDKKHPYYYDMVYPKDYEVQLDEK